MPDGGRFLEEGFLPLLDDEELVDGVTALLNNPDFWAPLTSTLVLTRGSGSPTFTRATTATVEDLEGKVQNVLSGEARFKGARRVRNWIPTDSSAFTAVGSVTLTTGQSDPEGGAKGVKVVCAASGLANRAASNIADFSDGGAASRLVVESVYLKGEVGGESVTIHDGWQVLGTVTLTSSWRRYSFTFNQDGTHAGHQVLAYAASGTPTFYIAFCQIESVTTQSNQNPSEYVSVGVLSAPYHGAGVDGVKYFETENGNTVASNVVTEATGAAIPASTLLGYLSEQASTNLVLQSENFGTTWTAAGSPTRSAAALSCGSVVLDLLGDDDGAAAESYFQPITFTGNAVKAVSFFVSKGTATSTLLQVWDNTAGANRMRAVVTWSGSTPVITMSDGTHLGTDTLGNGVFRVRFATTSVTAANANRIYVYPATNAAASDTAATGNVYIGGVQAENNSFPTDYIPTTTATVTRNADVLTYPRDGNVSKTQGWCYAEVFREAEATASNSANIVSIEDLNGRPLYWSNTLAATVTGVYDGTNTWHKTGLASHQTGVRKRASNWGGATMAVTGDGAAVQEGAFDGVMGGGAAAIIDVGGGAVGLPWNGNIRNVRIGTTKPANEFLSRVTA